MTHESAHASTVLAGEIKIRITKIVDSSIHYLDEVLVWPGQPVVHDVGGDDLDEEEGQLLGRLLGRVAQLLLLLVRPLFAGGGGGDGRRGGGARR